MSTANKVKHVKDNNMHSSFNQVNNNQVLHVYIMYDCYNIYAYIVIMKI